MGKRSLKKKESTGEDQGQKFLIGDSGIKGEWKKSGRRGDLEENWAEKRKKPWWSANPKRRERKERKKGKSFHPVSFRVQGY